jgi:putative transposase
MATSAGAMTLYQEKYRIEPTRLRDWDYRARGWYFITICTKNRAALFGEVESGLIQLSRLGVIADSELQTLHTHYKNVTVDIHVVMPNHIHAVIMIDGDHAFTPNPRPMKIKASAFISPEAGSLSAIVRSYKSGVTLRVREAGFSKEIWQPRFHDHLLRGDVTIAAVRDYIRNNPANWEEDKDNPITFLP